MADAPDSLTVESFGRKLRAGEVTAQAITDQCLDRIDADNSRLNAFIRVMADDARAQAAAADRELAAGIDRGPLHGVPISIKDLIDIRGVPTTAASRVRDGHIAERDAPAIAYLRQAGAVLIGKTNLHEFAFGTTNEDSAFGPARNPHDLSRSPGGSSGGSAVSVASGMALATVGTDTGGSIRIPAAACGIVGLKPTFGEVSTDRVVRLSPTMDHVGPLTRSVTDAWLVYRALVGASIAAPTYVASGDHPYVASGFSRTSRNPDVLVPVPIGGLRLAVPRAYFCELLDDEVRSRFEMSLTRLRAAGVRIDDTEIAHARDTAPIYLALVLADAASYHATTLDAMPERYTPPVRMRLEMGRYVLGEDYARALKGREVLRRDVDAALAGHDAIVLPTLPIPAPTLGAASVQVGGRDEPVRNLMLRQTQTFNLTAHPAISLPCGQTTAGLPCGLQLIGAHWQTEALLRVALACEPHLNL
jgi:aspartyl-tRNA(Asn)/glutamyl-tRNA(Gln) amidotransferase subunit A